MSELAKVEVQRLDDQVVIYLIGEIDLSNAEALQAEIEGEVGDARALILDLQQVEYLDSQGVRLLQRLAKTLSDAATEFEVVAEANSVAGNVLSITEMHRLIPIREPSD